MGFACVAASGQSLPRLPLLLGVVAGGWRTTRHGTAEQQMAATDAKPNHPANLAINT